MGQPVVHWEFWSRNLPAISKFYSTVFGWDIQVMSMPGMTYHMANTGSKRGIGGGMMEPPPGPLPGNMALYIEVPAIAPVLEKIRAAGGRVMVERQDVPGMGAFALFWDPEDRVNGIWEVTPAPPKKKKAPARRKKR